MMTGMQKNRAHSLEHRLLHALGHFVRHTVVRHVAPPDQHVGLVEHLLAQAVRQIVERHRADADFIAGKPGFQRAVNTVGIDGMHRFGCFFMKALVIYGYANQGSHLQYFDGSFITNNII